MVKEKVTVIYERLSHLGLVAILICSTPAMAAQPSPSLAEMLDAAVARNPGVELADAERNVGQALQRKAAQPLSGDPTFNIKYQTDAVGSGSGYREWESGVELPLWLPGHAGSYAREGEQALSASDALLSAKRLDIAGEVRERLWSALIARGEAAQSQAAVEAANELFVDVQRRVEAGELPRSDRLLAEKTLLEHQESAEQAKTRARQAALLFDRYTGLDLPERPDQEQPLLEDQIGEDHPAMRLSQARVEQARARRDRVSSERRTGPSVWVGGKSAKAMAGSDYVSAIGVEISMPFGTGGHTAPALAEAEASLTQAQVEATATRLALEDELARAALELERARAATAQTERRSRLAEESLKLSRRAFSLGETDLIRLLQAQADALAARHDLEIRQLELGQAVARLNQAQGVIPQ